MSGRTTDRVGRALPCDDEIGCRERGIDGGTSGRVRALRQRCGRLEAPPPETGVHRFGWPGTRMIATKRRSVEDVGHHLASNRHLALVALPCRFEECDKAGIVHGGDRRGAELARCDERISGIGSECLADDLGAAHVLTG
jgi:hypothetical protein